MDRIALARQAEDAFTDHLRDYPCHVLRPGRGFDRATRVTVATLQTMIAEYRTLSPGYFDLVITDECHRSIYGKWSAVLRHFDGIQIGLTATPCTADADALPDPEDGLFVRDTLRFFELTEPTYRYTLRRAIEEGHLVPYRIYRAMTVKTAAEDGFPVRRDELDWSAMDKSTQAEFEELFESSDTITVDPRALERKFTIPERNRAMVREFRDAHEKGFMGRDGIRRWPAWGKTIVFAVTRRHAETLAEMFDEHFAGSEAPTRPRAMPISWSAMSVAVPAPDASAIVKRFKEDDFPKILVSVNMLDTGFDCPEAVNLVMARFTRSAILYRQMRGRGTRKAPHIGKTGFTIFDFVGVTDFHGDDEGDIDGGPIREGDRPPGTGEPRMLLTLDVDDHIDPESRDWLTLDETGRIVRTPEHDARAAEVGVRFEAWRGEHEEFDAEQARWAELIGSRVRADAMNIDAFGGWDFDEHPFAALGGYDQARRVFGGEQSLGRLISGFNAAVFERRQAAGEPGGRRAGAR